MDDFTVPLKRGDTEPPISGIIRDEYGDPVDLTDATARFRMAEINSGENVINNQAIVLDSPEDGAVAYQWNDGDTDVEGTFLAEFAIDYDGNTGADFDADETFPRGEPHEYITIEIDPILD